MKDFDNEFGDFCQFKIVTFKEVNKRLLKVESPDNPIIDITKE
ncbi:hypothetical protein [Chryseobacterium schmidteae]|nr:hypothetical protein [Chryseobacterium schmidteae]